MERNTILSDKQFGYRRKRSTEIATLLLTNHIRKEIDKRNMVGALFIDLSKAFDTLSHSLIEKLRRAGVRGIALRWFTDYLFNRVQLCEFGGVRSASKPIVCGVPQG